MEKILSQDERIRRAEEIYARRQNAREHTKHATVNISEPKSFKLFKRIILQAIICLLIYFIFYLINTTNYSFSKVTLDKTDSLISDNIDFINIFNDIVQKINSYITNLNLNSNGNTQSENIIEDNIEESYQITEEDAQITENETIEIALSINDSNMEKIEPSETDKIKQNYSFIIPVQRMDII